MASIESVRASIDANIKTNGRQEITGVVMNAVLNNMVDLSEKNEGTLEEQKTLLNEQSRQIDSLEQKKANEDGKYPELTAGFANNLVGRGEAVDATINFRPSGGTSIEDGAARVKELKGNSVVWNQKADARNVTGSNTTITNISEHGFDMSAPQQSTDMLALLGPLFVNRKYYVGFSYTSTLPYSLQYMGGQRGLEASSDLRHVGIIGGQLAAEYTSIYWYIFGGTNAEWKLQVRDLVVYDLTQMFGEGNEPTSVEEFYNRIPQNVDLYAYNEGEVIHTNAEGIKSVGFNAWDEEWERGYWDETDSGIGKFSELNIRCKNFIQVLPNTQYCLRQPIISPPCVLFFDADKRLISSVSQSVENLSFTTPRNCFYIKFYVSGAYGATYNHDICINLAHSGYRNGEYQPYVQFIRDIDPRIKEAFPNGLRSAGTASDKVYNKNGKGIIEKRIGVVDMGTLSWGISAGASHSFYAANFATLYGALVNGNILSTKYVRGVAYSDAHSNLNASIDENANLYVRNDAYSDATTFKSAMNGVMLYYELAEPIITEYDEPFNLDYEVWDFGTEQMIATKPSAPIKANIVYGFNAVDSVRTAQLEIAALKTQIAQMQAIMASMTAQPAMIKE